METGSNTTSEPADQPPGTTPSWGRGHLDYTRSEGHARHASVHTEQAAAQDLDQWIDRLTTGEQLALAVSIRRLLTSRYRHLEEGTRTMTDITFGHRAAHAPPATMDHPSQWHYVATRLMAHMGAYSPDELNGLRWLWHKSAALRIRTAMQRHNIWATPGSPGFHGLCSMVERYPPGAETARAGPPPGEGDPSPIAMIMLETRQYYQVRITPHPQESHWNLEAVDSMLLASAALPDGPTPLPRDKRPDTLMAIASGEAGTWHPGHALYCLWRWAQRRWLLTRDRTATWWFHLDGRQHLEAIPQRERTAETPTATNLCPLFATHQIRALAMGGRLQRAICTETEAGAADTAPVHEILNALRSALVRSVGNLRGP